MRDPLYPSLYQINTRVWLSEVSRALGRATTLADIPDSALDRVADLGFDWVWLLSVWQTGPAGRQMSRTNPEWRREFLDTLPDLTDDDIAGSGFAITGYTVDPGLGGDQALAELRGRLRQRGLRLMLDFVPNHTAIDHPWVETHPEYYVHGTELDLTRAPKNYVWVKRPGGDLLLAHGRDPFFPGWSDTLQLNYGNPATQDAMIEQLLKIAGQCDGVRCDMAMLVLPDVFERTWGMRTQPFWPNAIGCVRERVADFCFMAEVYWDLEWTMQQQGFDYAYDKRLYDRLVEGQAGPVRDHFRAGLDYQNRLARFLENHDEPRAAATFTREVHEAAAVITYLSPGLRFFHQGQPVLSTTARRPPSSAAAERSVAADRRVARLGGQLDLGVLGGVCVARVRRRALASGRELRPESEPRVSATAVCGSRRAPLAAERAAGRYVLRARGRRPELAGALRGLGALAIPRLRTQDAGRIRRPATTEVGRQGDSRPPRVAGGGIDASALRFG